MELNEADALQTLYGVAERLMETRWADNIQAIREGSDIPVSDLECATTAIMLENLHNYISRMDENSRSTQIGGFINHGFELITAVMPSLVANQVVSVQPMTKKIGEVFYLEFLYGSDKGSIASGSDMFAHGSAGNANTFYSSEQVVSENIGTGDGLVNPTISNLKWFPVRNDAANSFTIVLSWTNAANATITYTVPSTGILGSPAFTAGTLTEETGVWLFAPVFTNSATYIPKAGTAITVTYYYNMEGDASTAPMIPEVDLKITSEPMTAQPRKLRARYTLDASYDLQMAFGKSADAELTTALASEIRQEIDGTILNQLYASAAAGSTTFQFDATKYTSLNIAYVDHKWSFIDVINSASNAIFQDTRRARGNFMVCGTNVATLLMSLAPRFKQDGVQKPGPHYLGTLDGQIKVYLNPFYSPNNWMVGYKGNMFLEAGFVYAPYLLLYTTPTVMLSDFVAQKGMASMSGSKFINTSFYAKGSITPANLGP